MIRLTQIRPTLLLSCSRRPQFPTRLLMIKSMDRPPSGQIQDARSSGRVGLEIKHLCSRTCLISRFAVKAAEQSLQADT